MKNAAFATIKLTEYVLPTDMFLFNITERHADDAPDAEPDTYKVKLSGTGFAKMLTLRDQALSLRDKAMLALLDWYTGDPAEMVGKTATCTA